MNRRLIVVALLVAGAALCCARPRWGDAPRDSRLDRSWEVTISGRNNQPEGGSGVPGLDQQDAARAGPWGSRWSSRDGDQSGGGIASWGARDWNSRDSQRGSGLGQQWNSRDNQRGSGLGQQWNSRDSQHDSGFGQWNSRDNQRGSGFGQWNSRDSQHGSGLGQQWNSRNDQWAGQKSFVEDQDASANVSGGSILGTGTTQRSPSGSPAFVRMSWPAASGSAPRQTSTPASVHREHEHDDDNDDDGGVVEQHAHRGTSASSAAEQHQRPTGWSNLNVHPEAQAGRPSAAPKAVPQAVPKTVPQAVPQAQHQPRADHDHEPAVVHQYFGRRQF